MIQSIQRAFEVLEYIASNGNCVRINDIATAMMLSKNTVFGIVDTLVRLGYIEQDELTPRYKLTSQFDSLCVRAVSINSIKQKARIVLKRVSSELGHTSYLAIQMGSYFRYELKSEPNRGVRISLVVGKRLEMGKTAIGKVFISHSSHLRRLMKAEVSDDEVKSILACGYATDIQDYKDGVNCLALPLIVNNKIVGVVGVSGFSNELPEYVLRDSYEIVRGIIREEFDAQL